MIVLRDFLVDRYDDLKRRLTLHLGSADLAGDALQDTWMRLHNDKDAAEPVQYPLSYLLRMATNSALDKLRSEKRYLTGAEVDLVLNELSDPAPTPEETLLTRLEVQKLAMVMSDMPLRRRNILMLIRVEQLSRQEVAQRLGVSLSLVDRELKRAHEFVVEHMK